MMRYALLFFLSVFPLLLGFFFFKKRWQEEKKHSEKLESTKQCLEIENAQLKVKTAQIEELEKRLKETEEKLIEYKIREKELLTHLHAQQKATEEKIILLAETEEKLSKAFKALSTEVLEKSNQSFLHLAKETLGKFQEKASGDLEKRQQSIDEIIKPVKESLLKLDQGMRFMEKERKGEQASLKTQIHAMIETEKELKRETSTLVKALRMPIVRGRWGEMQLKRVVELAGMLNHCDFYEQESASSGQIRPDLIVRLPGGKQIVVDAKTPCEAYLEAIQSQDLEIKEKNLKRHARHVRQHIIALGKKGYWETFQPTPEFVVLFIPSDTFFSSALEYDPTLIEIGVKQGVIIATPTTLIGLLRAIAYGWKQEKLSQHAEEISMLGHELYKRIVDMGHHWIKMGRALAGTVESYNKAVGCMESRVLVTARKFQNLGATARNAELKTLEGVERIPRKIQAIEMQDS